jgi:hypothetical protein
MLSSRRNCVALAHGAASSFRAVARRASRFAIALACIPESDRQRGDLTKIQKINSLQRARIEALSLYLGINFVPCLQKLLGKPATLAALAIHKLRLLLVSAMYAFHQPENSKKAAGGMLDSPFGEHSQLLLILAFDLALVSQQLLSV